MADFQFALKITSINEGGYSNDPSDNGNWTGGRAGSGALVGTKYGISAPVLKVHLGRTPTIDDMKTLTKSQSDHIYKTDYWDAIRGDEIHDDIAAAGIFDMAINAGVKNAVILAQRALMINENGVMDDFTLQKLNN